MHYLCQECQKSFPNDQLFTIAKQVGGQTKLLRVCVDCKEKHEKDLERTRQSFSIQYDNNDRSSIPTNIDIPRLIDEAMEKKDRSVYVFIGKHGTSITVYPYSENDNCWKYDHKSKEATCPSCGRPSEECWPYCHWCGEQLGLPQQEDK